MTTDTENTPLIWGNQTEQFTLWLVRAAQHYRTCSSHSGVCLPLSRLCWYTFKYRSGLCQGKDRKHFSLSCVILALFPFSSSTNFSQKFSWSYHICWIPSYCSGHILLVFSPRGIYSCQSSAFIFVLVISFFPHLLRVLSLNFISVVSKSLTWAAGLLKEFPVFPWN